MSAATLSADDPELSPGQAAFTVERDPSFVRLDADEFTVITRGATTELSLIITGPDVDRLIVEVGDRGTVKHVANVGLKASYTEVARVRLLTPNAMRLAVEILARGVELKMVDPDGVKSALDEFVRFYEESAAAQASGSPTEAAQAETRHG